MSFFGNFGLLNRTVRGSVARGRPFMRARDRTRAGRETAADDPAPPPLPPPSGSISHIMSCLLDGPPAPQFDLRPLYLRLRAPEPTRRTHVIWKRLPGGLAHMFMDGGRSLCTRKHDKWPCVMDRGGAKRLGDFLRTEDRLCAMCASYSDEAWAEQIMRRERVRENARRHAARIAAFQKTPKRRGRPPTVRPTGVVERSMAEFLAFVGA